ncbi:MAG: hypothetical protein J0M19_16230, partial [Sphingomonadales bacterium]|nr:hypothetical protein [Sphingomonadales bacterium]
RSVIDGSDFGDNVLAALPDTIAQTMVDVAMRTVARGGGGGGALSLLSGDELDQAMAPTMARIQRDAQDRLADDEAAMWAQMRTAQDARIAAWQSEGQNEIVVTADRKLSDSDRRRGAAALDARVLRQDRAEQTAAGQGRALAGVPTHKKALPPLTYGGYSENRGIYDNRLLNVTIFQIRYDPDASKYDWGPVEQGFADDLAQLEQKEADARAQALSVQPFSLDLGGSAQKPAFDMKAMMSPTYNGLAFTSSSTSQGSWSQGRGITAFDNAKTELFRATESGYDLRDSAYNDFNNGHYAKGTFKYFGSLGLRTLQSLQVPFTLTTSAVRGNGFEPTSIDRADGEVLSLFAGAAGLARKGGVKVATWRPAAESEFVGPLIGKSGFRTSSEFAETVGTRYQGFVDEGYVRALRAEANGQLSGLKSTRIGDAVDRFSQARLSAYLRSEGIAEGPGKLIQINRWLPDPAGSGLYVRPDVRIPAADRIFDATVGFKAPGSTQITGFSQYSGGNYITVTRPATLPSGGSYSIVP